MLGVPQVVSRRLGGGGVDDDDDSCYDANHGSL